MTATNYSVTHTGVAPACRHAIDSWNLGLEGRELEGAAGQGLLKLKPL